MTEAERLGKICDNQSKEIARLRRLLKSARVIQTDFSANQETNTLSVICTCIGVDEETFIDNLKPELTLIAEAIASAKVSLVGPALDTVTNEPIVPGGSERP